MSLFEQSHARATPAADPRDIATILERISDAFFALDTDWRFTYLYSQSEPLLQRRREDLLGKNIWDEFPEAVGSTFHTMYHRAMETQHPVQFEEFYPPLDVWFSVHAYPAPDGLSVYFHDITERRRTEEAARVRDRHFRLLAETVPQIVFITDTNGLIAYFNPQWYAYTGLPPGSADAQDWLAMIHPDDVSGLLARWEIARASEAMWEAEYRLKRYDGAYRWHLGRSVPLRDDAGEVVNWFGQATDIEDRMRAERALRESEERFRHLADAMPQIVWTANPDGYIDYYNERWYAFTGLPRGVGGDPSWEPVLHPDDLQACHDTWYGAVRAGSPY